jgi:hypothetical protein
MEANSLRFASAARALGQRARGQGFAVPGFRSPPRLPDVDRTLRRRSDGGVSVAVRLRGRPWSAVLSDMVEGVVAANRLTGGDADGLRRALWAALEAETLPPSAPSAPSAAETGRRPRHLSVARRPEAA